MYRSLGKPFNFIQYSTAISSFASSCPPCLLHILPGASFPASSPSTPARSLSLATDLYKNTVVLLFLIRYLRLGTRLEIKHVRRRDDDDGQNKFLQINDSEENLSYVIIRMNLIEYKKLERSTEPNFKLHLLRLEMQALYKRRENM